MPSRPPRERAQGFSKVWPAAVALAVVVLIALGTLAVDVYVDRGSASRSAELVDDAIRSVVLVGDLRYHAAGLTRHSIDPNARDAILANIKSDSVAYAPLASYPGEREEWLHLQRLLARAQAEHPLSPDSRLNQWIEDSAARLVTINQRQAAALASDISRLNSSGIFLDLLLGALTITAASVIAAMLVRSYRKQRELLAAHLALLDDRASELEAFEARVAHDLKGPLTPIVFASDVLANSPHEDVKPMANRVRTSARKMSAMIDDLLSLSVTGRPPTGTTDVAPVVTDLLDELRPELEGAAVDVSVPACKVACPSEVLEEMLRNLIGNASKYRSPDRELALAIDARPDRDHVEIVVADNGVGMSEDVRAHAFDPFFRAQEKLDVSGHGLGLAIVKRTAEALGGSCRLDSAPGRGTRVALELPAAA